MPGCFVERTARCDVAVVWAWVQRGLLGRRRLPLGEEPGGAERLLRPRPVARDVVLAPLGLQRVGAGDGKRCRRGQRAVSDERCVLWVAGAEQRRPICTCL